MPDFFEASKRHFSDAEFLRNNARLPNAAQLFGFAAECGVKALIEKLDNNVLLPDYQKHADGLVNLLHKYRLSVNGLQGAKYFAMLGRFKVFGTWHAYHRYEPESDIPLTRYLNGWKTASEDVQKMLQQAQLDGVL